MATTSDLGRHQEGPNAPAKTEGPLGSERRVLTAMPLHAITAVHGEAGLRNRLAAEIALLPQADRERVERALALASGLHARDRRQREPYVNHLLRVTIRIIAYYGVTDPDVLCAALLHDAVEDHPDDIGPGRIAAQFGERVAELVAAVTVPEPEPGRDRHEQYREHVAASLDANPWARVIKLSDFTDNGVGLIHTTGPALTRLAAKYAPLVPVLRDLTSRPDTPLSDAARARVLEQLDRADARFALVAQARAAQEL